MPYTLRLLTILIAATGLTDSARASDGGALAGHRTKSATITASFLDGVVPEVATAVSSPVPSKAKAKPKRSQSPLGGGDPIGRIIALRTGAG